MKHCLRPGASSRGFGRCRNNRTSQDGAVAPMMVLALISGLIVVGFAVDTLRMTSDASQLKRATDAAALAIGREYLRSDKQFDVVSQTLARDYVRANLGLDSELRETLGDVHVIRARNASDDATFEVTAQFTSKAALSGNPAQTITVRSKVEAHVAFTEVALVLPAFLNITPESAAAMARISQNFAESIIRNDGHVFMSVVPHDQRVNVYDPRDPGRIVKWAKPEASNPKELEDFFKDTGIKSLASPDMPDLRSQRICLLRGLDLNDNYFWDQAPSNQFYIGYWWPDTLANAPPNSPSKFWQGRYRDAYSPEECPSEGSEEAVDERVIVADKGCPLSSILPLTNNIDEIKREFNTIKGNITTFEGRDAGNPNYGFAMGWAAMTLAPSFRGRAGWGGSPNIPFDFDQGNDAHQKVIISFIKTTPDNFFSDSDLSVKYTGCKPTSGIGVNYITDRYKSLCKSLREKKIRSYFLVMGPDETDGMFEKPLEKSRRFRGVAQKGFEICTEKKSDIRYFRGRGFNEVESSMQTHLVTIASELKQRGSFVRLVQ
ncbi:TadE/TadG family type IV pilus assembly protein [Methylobacterium sp. WL64]|uniref:TadE/TadG family type IV pilus assembly protein n=1 Tax=Methylobacterium sp. WL64 TaxID=2603894 RepID=UPI002484BDC5|nr:TadE/TadG family type IV pilus assembly protein [Methylobacterium sp. WL64]